MSMPLVSVFIPYYNDSAFLKDAIESVLKQTYKNFELILLNHASTDNSRQIAHSYQDERIKHIDMPKNLGAGSAILIEEYLKIAKGEYAKLFCADDIMLPNCIETLLSKMQENPQIDIIWADMEYVDKDQKSLKTKWSLERRDFNFDYDEHALLKKLFDGRSVIPYPTTFVKMDVLKSIKKDPTLIMLLDMSLWVDALINGAKIKFIKDVVVNYRIHDEQTSSSHNKDIIITRSFFEAMTYMQLFNKIKDVSLVKKLCEHLPFDDLTQKDEEFIPFLLAYNNLSPIPSLKKEPYRNWAYLYIHDLLSDDEKRKKLEDRFNFGIKEFRDLYSADWKKEKKTEELTVFYLTYLLFCRILKCITLQNLFKRKKYTL